MPSILELRTLGNQKVTSFATVLLVREYEVGMFERGAGLVRRGLDMLAMFYADDSPLSIVDFFREKGAPIAETEI